jgi:hypothetical protein
MLVVSPEEFPNITTAPFASTACNAVTSDAPPADERPSYVTRWRLTGRLGLRDSNLCILESEFAKTLSRGAGLELAHPELMARPIDA